MIPASLYQTIYLIAITILTFLCCKKYSEAQNDHTQSSNNTGGYIIALAFALFIGFRPLSGRYFVDMVNYHEVYYAMQYGRDFIYHSNWNNYLPENLLNWLGANHYDLTVFFVLMAIIYFVGAFSAFTRLFKDNALLAFCVFLGAFSTFSYGTNGIKAGVAASLFLCALSYYNKPLISIIFLALSLGFHHSMVMPIAAFFIVRLYNNPKFYFGLWIFALILSMAHITFFQQLFGSMADESGASYLRETESWGGKTGFRYDFVLYSSLPVIVGYVSLFKYKLINKEYAFIYNLYLLTNAIWMLCMYASFTNRIAYLSWFIYPVVSIYPLFQKSFMPNQEIWLKRVIWIQLLFTLAMSFIYYG